LVQRVDELTEDSSEEGTNIRSETPVYQEKIGAAPVITLMAEKRKKRLASPCLSRGDKKNRGKIHRLKDLKGKSNRDWVPNPQPCGGQTNKTGKSGQQALYQILTSDTRINATCLREPATWKKRRMRGVEKRESTLGVLLKTPKNDSISRNGSGTEKRAHGVFGWEGRSVLTC